MKAKDMSREELVAAVESVLQKNKAVCFEGLELCNHHKLSPADRRKNLDESRKSMLSDRCLLQFQQACVWLEQVERTEEINEAAGDSYGFKHIAESFIDRMTTPTGACVYVSNGMLIAAALFLGFKVKANDSGINAVMNISMKSAVLGRYYRDLNRGDTCCPSYGIVYFIQPKGRPSDPIKIGFSRKSAKLRATQLEQSNPWPMEILASFVGNEAVEKELHKKFKHLKIGRGREWFSPAPDLLAYIEKLKSERMEVEAPASQGLVWRTGYASGNGLHKGKGTRPKPLLIPTRLSDEESAPPS